MKRVQSFRFGKILSGFKYYCFTLPAGISALVGGFAWIGLAGPVDHRHPFVADELIIGFKTGVAEGQENEVEKRHGDRSVQKIRGLKARRVKLGAHRTLDQAIREYEAEGVVAYAEPNYIVHALAVPNDTYFSLQWALYNTGQTILGVPGTPGADIEATAAWDVTTGTSAVVVGVVDTGIDYTHPDLAANIWSNPGGISGGPAGSHGYDAVGNDFDPTDPNGHGTHVTGTIGAAGNNGIGVVGVNWTTSIMGLRFLDATGSGTTANAIDAINWAVQAKQAGVNLRVLNNSWGGGGFSQALLDAINLAAANDILFVVAAGNESANNDLTPAYPANYNAPNILAVAATDNNDNLASFSNFGATTVGLGAPGANIGSTYPGNSYVYLSGTSMAAPHVSGAAALLLALGYQSVANLRSTLLNNVDPIASLAGKMVTGGRLNVDKAVQASSGVPPSPDFTIAAAPASQSVTAGSSVSYTITLTPVGGFSDLVNLSLSGLPNGASASFDVNPVSVTGTGGSAILTVTTGSTTPAGAYPLTITGVSGNLTHAVTVSLKVPSFSISVSPTSRTVSAGSKASYTVKVTALGGFASTVSLSVSGLPSNTSATFSPSSLPGSGSSTMRVSTNRRTPKGTYSLTVTGTGGGLTKTTSVSLTVR